jgi:hypothetical protein
MTILEDQDDDKRCFFAAPVAGCRKFFRKNEIY